jgi:hypothetical protein
MSRLAVALIDYVNLVTIVNSDSLLKIVSLAILKCVCHTVRTLHEAVQLH